LGGDGFEKRSEAGRHAAHVRVNPHKLQTERACGLGSKSSALKFIRGVKSPSTGAARALCSMHGCAEGDHVESIEGRKQSDRAK